MKVKLTIVVHLYSPLNVGLGEIAGQAVDRPTIKRRSTPYIPASTLKGKLRDACEQIQRVLSPDFACWSPEPDLMCKENPCPVCRLFGSPWQKGALYFEDAQPIQEGLEDQEKRAGIAVSRLRSAAMEGKLFFTSAVPAGKGVFTATIEGETGQQGLSLLLKGISLVDFLGSSSSRGLGWCHMEVTELLVNSNQAEAQEYLKL